MLKEARWQGVHFVFYCTRSLMEAEDIPPHPSTTVSALYRTIVPHHNSRLWTEGFE